MPYLSCKKIENDVYNFPTWQYCKYKDIFDSRIIINSTAKFYISISYQKDLLSIDTRIFTPSDDYFFTWTRTQATLCKHLQFLEEHISEKTMISIWNATLITLYLNYDITEDFQTQFQQNSDAILSLIETLGTVDIPKKS